MQAVEITQMLYTARLTLTRFSWANPRDIQTAIGVFHDPVCIANQGEVNLHTEDDLRRWERGTALSLPTLTAAYKKVGRSIPAEELAPPTLPWYIIHLGANNPTGEHIGIITIMEGKPAIPHIGWAFFSQHAGKGYATEAAREVLHYWREDFGIDVVMALTDLENRGSYHLAEKLGMVPNPTHLLWKAGESDFERVKGGAPVPDVEMRCYLTPDAPAFPEGTEFDLFKD